MSHSLTKPGGWALNEKLTSAQATDLDEKTRDSVDKTSAGDTVSGVLSFDSTAGVTLASLATLTALDQSVVTFEADCTLDIETSVAEITGTGKLSTTSGGRIELADDDFPLLRSGHTGRSKTRMMPLVALGHFAAVGTWDVSYPLIGEAVSLIHSAGATGTIQFGLRDLHNGATLSTVDVWMRPSSGARGGSLVGITPPYIKVERTGSFSVGGTFPAAVSLASSSPAYLSFPAYADYVAGTKMYRIRITCDQNNVIDTTQYQYTLTIGDEELGTAALNNEFFFAVFSFTSIADMRFQ